MTTERRLKPDPWKNEVYLRRGKRSLVSWQGWSNIPKEENDNHAPKKAITSSDGTGSQPRRAGNVRDS